MKVAVFNLAKQVGKTTVARHLLVPRIESAELITVQSTTNIADRWGRTIPVRHFGQLQEYLQLIDSAVVDIEAGEEVLTQMRKHPGSQEDFDCFVVPTMVALSQQIDTMATLIELARLGVPPCRQKVVFIVEDDLEIAFAFECMLDFVTQHPIAEVCTTRRLRLNEVYERASDEAVDTLTLARDETDYKALIGQTRGTAEKLALARKLVTRRLAIGVEPELNECFTALGLGNNEQVRQVSIADLHAANRSRHAGAQKRSR